MQGVIRRALKEDVGRLAAFLFEAGLGTDGLNEESAEYFLLLEDGGGRLKGSLGMEAFTESGLLRSLAVAAGQAEQEILLLFEQMLLLAREKDMKHLFLATNKSGVISLFELLGFTTVQRQDLPAQFYDSPHIRHILNVDNTVFLQFLL